MHPSHDLFVIKGVFFCIKCAHYSGTKLHHLAHECDGVLDRFRKAQINRMMKGMRPTGLPRWPVVQQGTASVLLGTN